MVGLMALAVYVAMGGEVLSPVKARCPSIMECQGQEAGVSGLGSRVGAGYRGLLG